MDTGTLADQIEAYLQTAAGFVSKRQICERFDIPERLTRADDKRPGLLDGFAVSSTREGQSGFIHHDFLPNPEWIPIKHRLLRHGIAEFRKVRRWTAARKRCQTGKRPEMMERHTGQMVFL